jgi:hypothetical protein
MSVMNGVKLAAQIRSIRNNTKNLRTQVQEALISCAYHAVKDGQITPFNQLLDAVGNGTRVKGLTLWAETYGFVRVKEGRFVLNKSARDKTAVLNEDDFAPFEKAMREDVQWYDMVPKEAVKSAFDPSTYLTHVLEKLEKEGVKEIVPYIEKAIAEFNQAQAIKSLATEAANASEEQQAA